MKRGYVALWRKIQDNKLWKERRTFSKAEAWIDLIMEAQHSREPTQVLFGMQALTQNYGECLKSTKAWGRRWRWSEGKVRRFFNLLSELKQICVKNERKTTRLTLLNYSLYDPRRLLNDAQTTRKRRATDDKQECLKNEKKEKNNNNREPDPTRSTDDDPSCGCGFPSSGKSEKQKASPQEITPEQENYIELKVAHDLAKDKIRGTTGAYRAGLRKKAEAGSLDVSDLDELQAWHDRPGEESEYDRASREMAELKERKQQAEREAQEQKWRQDIESKKDEIQATWEAHAVSMGNWTDGNLVSWLVDYLDGLGNLDNVTRAALEEFCGPQFREAEGLLVKKIIRAGKQRLGITGHKKAKNITPAI